MGIDVGFSGASKCTNMGAHRRPSMMSELHSDAHAKHAHGHGKPAIHSHEAVASAHAETDPVCGMSVDPATTPHRAVHGDRSFYFCSAGCRAKFAADPARWLTRVTEKTDAAPAAEGR